MFHEETTQACAHAHPVQEIFEPGNARYGRLVCNDCGRFLRWLPFPTRDPKSLTVPECAEDLPLPELQGSDAQVRWAETIRDRRLNEFYPRRQEKLYRAMRQITKASWWIGNKDRSFEAIRWPEEWMGQPAAPSAPARSLRAPIAPEAPAKRQFEVTVEQLAGGQQGVCCALRVTFDGGRSSGNLTFTLAEMKAVRDAINNFLVEE